MARYRYHGSHPFMPKARQIAIDRERKYLANNAYRFDGHDYVAAHLRKRARDRMHTIYKELMYLQRNPISRNPARQFVPRWNRANVGISGTHTAMTVPDGYRRLRYHVKFRRK